MTGILVTLRSWGPDAERQVGQLVDGGLTGVRVIAKGRPALDIVRDVEALLALTGDGRLPGPVWVDFPGLRPRVARVVGSGVVRAGADVTVSDMHAEGHVRLQHGQMIIDRVHPGSELLFADGLIRLRVERIVSEHVMHCCVVVGGTIRPQRSVSLKADDHDVDHFGITELDVDVARRLGTPSGLRYVVSWVRNAQQVTATAQHVSLELIIPKLESALSTADLASIMTTSAAPVLVGRADLAAGVPWAGLRTIVDAYVAAARHHGRAAFVGSLLVDSLERSDQASARDIDDLEHLLEIGVTGFLVSGTGDPEIRLRKVRTIASAANRSVR